MSTKCVADPPLTVLVIDDDAVLRATADGDLTEAGFAVRLAADGPNGLAAFKQCAPDVVLLDVTMPGMDGFAVCQRLRTLPCGADTPVMMLTGHHDLASVEKALEVGATDFAVKPINGAVLVHRVRYLLRSAQTAAQLRRDRASLHKAQQLAKMGSWELDAATKMFLYTPELARLVGHDNSSRLTAPLIWAAVHPDDREQVRAAHRSALRSGSARYEVEFRLVQPHGERCFHQEVEIVFDHSGRPARTFGTLQDITERREAEARIESLSFFDPATGLPNRALFSEHLTRALATAERYDRKLGVLLLKVNRLERVNKSWGHAIGDTVLRQLATRLNDCLRTSDIAGRTSDEPKTLARFGDDAFAVLLTELRKPEDAARVARRFNAALSAPLTIEDTEVVLTSSIGISLYPLDGVEEQVLFKNAAAAVDALQASGRDGYEFYTDGSNTQSLAQFSLEADLRYALEREEFELHYQPKVATDGRVTGMEALVRWRRRGRLVSPAKFIPLAEETGLIISLGAWVLASACAQTARWHEEGFPELRVSVNLSALQLQDERLIETVTDALARSNLAPDSLELELTESMLMTHINKSIRKLQELRALGVHLSIDDFGTGFSSLSYLKRLPITALKIDRCFIQDLATDDADLAIVRGTISLAHNLGLRVVAEGVEEEVQRELLYAHGCDEIQGYFYSPPRNPDEFIAWLLQHRGPAKEPMASVSPGIIRTSTSWTSGIS